jgi:hypothetical protein
LDTWADQLSELGGVSAEVDIAALGNTVLDLTLAHPSGIAQLYAGRTTALRSLVREKSALAGAMAAAEAVKEKADQHAAKYGLPPTHLGLGIAFWNDIDQSTGEQIPRRVPVILRPIALERGKLGMELELEPTLRINPVLIQLLSERGIPIDPEVMARDAMAGASFNPAPVLEAIRAMGQAACDGFRVRNKLIVGVFEHPGQVLMDDLAASRQLMMTHPVIGALAGDLVSRSELAQVSIGPPIPQDRPPDHERGVGDLNVSQFHVLDLAAAGTSALIDRPAAAPGAATIAAVIADAVGSGRSVLYVCGNTDGTQAVAKTLRAFGLGELLLDLEPSHDWRDRALTRLISGLRTEAPTVDVDGIGQIRNALAERCTQLADYFELLHGRLPDWQASPADALRALAQITSQSPATRTACQLDRAAVTALAGPAREEAKQLLRRALELGLTHLTEDMTAWLGTGLRTERQTEVALAALGRLRQGSVTQTIAHMRDVTERTGLAQCASMAGWGSQLSMLRGVREALDQFIPEIFERSPQDMVAATATPEWRTAHNVEQSRRLRGRLRRQARDLVRPGLQVDDLHQALLRVETQREIWLSWSPSLPWPKLPVGMPQIEAEYEVVLTDLEIVNAALPAGRTPLSEMPFSELLEFLERLNADRDSLSILPELGRLTQELTNFGLAPLLDDLRQRRAGAAPDLTGDPAEAANQAAVLEVDFAWWSSLLTYALKDSPALAQMSGPALAALVDSYRELDIAHTATKPIPIRAAAAAWRDRAAEAYPGQAFKLAHIEAGTSLRQAFAMAPDVALRARPCVLAGPVMVPQALPLAELGSPPFDLVIIDGADTMTPALAACAIARGRQVLVAGDAARAAGVSQLSTGGLAGGATQVLAGGGLASGATQAGTDAPDGPEGANSTQDLAGIAGASLTAAVAEFLPHVLLPSVANERDPRLTGLLEARGYATLGPAVPSREPDPRISWRQVDAVGQVASNTGQIDASNAEVDATVELVEVHLTRWPGETLAVMTASAAFAERIRFALRRAAKAGNPAITRALALDGPERLVVADSTQAVGLSRDGVILAPGLPRSPRGAMLYQFGSFSGDDGAVRLSDVLLAGRLRLMVVSSLKVADMAPERLHGAGPRLLRDVIATASDPQPLEASGPQVSDPLLADLARRVERRGAHVTANYGPPQGPWIKLAVRPDPGPPREKVAVLTDDPAFMSEPSIRAKLRYWPAALERAGWQVRFAWTAPVFMEPEAEARGIAKLAFSAS